MKPKVFGICSKDSNAMKSDNPNSGFYEAETSRTIDTSNQSPCKNQGGMVVIEGNGTRPSHHGDGWKESETMYTLNTSERHAVAFSEVHSSLSANDGPKGPSLADRELCTSENATACRSEVFSVYMVSDSFHPSPW